MGSLLGFRFAWRNHRWGKEETVFYAEKLSFIFSGKLCCERGTWIGIILCITPCCLVIFFELISNLNVCDTLHMSWEAKKDFFGSFFNAS